MKHTTRMQGELKKQRTTGRCSRLTLNADEFKGWLWNCPLPREALRILLVMIRSNTERLRVNISISKKDDDYSYIDEKVCRDVCLAYRKEGKRKNNKGGRI